MMTVYKYPLCHVSELRDEILVSMPDGAELLTAQVQGENLCVWALVDPFAAQRMVAFRIAGTGHPVNEPGRYLATFQLLGGAFIGHVFHSAPEDA